MLKMITKFKIGDKVKVSKDNDNSCYNNFRNKVLIITHIATNKQEHQGYDEGVNEPLYSFEDEEGKEIPYSLYEYELEKV